MGAGAPEFSNPGRGGLPSVVVDFASFSESMRHLLAPESGGEARDVLHPSEGAVSHVTIRGRGPLHLLVVLVVPGVVLSIALVLLAEHPHLRQLIVRPDT